MTYLVYAHVDPVEPEIVYIGQGTLDRPWQVRNRSKQHEDFLVGSCYNWSMYDIVQILHRFKTKEEAIDKELELIAIHRPKYNKNYDFPLVALTKEGFDEALAMRKDGWSYSKIARELQTSTMTVFRAINGRTKAYDKWS